jgi:hypothetical protein
MPLLRKITKAKWYDAPWLPAGDVPADALVDLRTQKNELSVWRVERDEANLNAVIAALASNKTDRVANLDYVLLEDEVVAALGIQCVKTDGDSPHTDANARWHCDLIELTATKVVRLAEEMKRREAEHKRLLPNMVKSILVSALQAGELQRTEVTPKLLTALEDSSPTVPEST